MKICSIKKMTGTLAIASIAAGIGVYGVHNKTQEIKKENEAYIQQYEAKQAALTTDSIAQTNYAKGLQAVKK